MTEMKMSLCGQEVTHAEERQYLMLTASISMFIVQELCESRGGRPGLSVLMSLLVSVDVRL